MENLEHLRQTLEYYKQQRQKKLDEYRAADLLVRQIEIELNETPSSPETPPPNSSSSGAEGGRIAKKNPEIRPDEFFAMSQNEAAKTYLRKIGRAIPFDQLVDALRSGGAQLGGADPKKTLSVSIGRNPLKEFVYPNDDVIGLREFYPNLAKVTAAKGPKKNKKLKKHKARRTGRTKPSKQKTQKPADGTVNSIRSKMRQFLKDEPHSAEEIVQFVESALGSVKKILVYGALRSREFSKQEDGKYKLSGK